MRNTYVPGDKEEHVKPTREPLSAVKHFWLSFLAVVTGVPVAALILSGVFFVFSILFFIFLAIALSASAPPSNMPMQLAYGDEFSSNTLVAVPIHGVILSGTAADPLQSLFGQSYADGEQIKEQLRALSEDDTVDGVILEIDSPGGMINASKAIADGIKYYKEQTGKPVFAHINGSGASGAYWAAAATDEIYAEQGSEAGSIGVIMGPLVTLSGVVSYGDVSTTEPIGFKYYTAGRSKDIGNPFRAITPEEDAFLNQQIAVEYERFVTHVSQNRDIAAETIKGDIGALPYGTVDALRLKLIDGEKSKEETYDLLAKTAGISDDYKIMRVDNTTDFFGSLFGVKTFLTNMRMSGADKAAGRTRFCETNLLNKPLVYSGDIKAVCQ